MPKDGYFECGEVLLFVVFSTAITCSFISIASVGQASYADDTVIRTLASPAHARLEYFDRLHEFYPPCSGESFPSTTSS